MRINHQQSGFSLIETLIALTVFSVGFIGIAQFTGKAVKATGTSAIKAVSLNIMTQKLTPLFLHATGTRANFLTEFQIFTAADGETIIDPVTNIKYKIRIIEAEDDDSKNLMGATPPAVSTWLSPITVGVEISIVNPVVEGAPAIADTNIGRAPYTFLLPPV